MIPSSYVALLNQQAGCEKGPKFVEINYMNEPSLINTFDKVYFVFNPNQNNIGSKESSDSTSVQNLSIVSSTSSYKSEKLTRDNKTILPFNMPKVNVTIIDTNYPCSEFSLPENYTKFNQKSTEKYEDEVEYDMDDEDIVWLNMINQQRNDKSLKDKKNVPPINYSQFEMAMDRLEKESSFEQTNKRLSISNKTFTPLKVKSSNDSTLNDDTFCCVCLDGECVNSNAILFCDMCNLAVHQECYGVPYIPEGQWLCRRCLHSPGNPVSCELCPNEYGVFKQTNRGSWAHVSCAIWIPEVHFANTVFLEPIIGLEDINKARWKLTCYICHKKNAGACIQCAKQSCYTAFHVTCAQQAGLYMSIKEEYSHYIEKGITSDTSRKKKGRQSNSKKNKQNEDSQVVVKKIAFCELHTPLETAQYINVEDDEELDAQINPKAKVEEVMKKARLNRIKRAQKSINEFNNLAPKISLPVISKESIRNIKNKMTDIFYEKNDFFEKIVKYWLMKRYSRNGVPLLRRLQDSKTLKLTPNNTNKSTIKPNISLHDPKTKTTPRKIDSEKIKNDLDSFRKLRHDMNNIRTLLGLISKREQLKVEQIKILHAESAYELNEFNGIFLPKLLDNLIRLDVNKFFIEPVDPKIAPNYYEEIKEPMCFQNIQLKISTLKYQNFFQFENDFKLIIKNCCQYNPKNSVHYQAAVKLKDKSASILKQAKKNYEKSSFPDVTNE